eukprot:scaffold103780_cov60-Phaeocystis_antarctica.AAC.1
MLWPRAHGGVPPPGRRRLYRRRAFRLLGRRRLRSRRRSARGCGGACPDVRARRGLVAGDLVLTEKGGVPSVDRVVVNQHRQHTACTAELLTLVHAAGSLTLGPGHV